MKKKLLAVTVSLMAVLVLVGCDKSDKVSHNLSKEADNFNSTRQLTVINAIQGDTLFQMTGRMSIKADSSDNQLEVVVEEKEGKYKKHFIGLSDNVTYIVEDVIDIIYQVDNAGTEMFGKVTAKDVVDGHYYVEVKPYGKFLVTKEQYYEIEIGQEMPEYLKKRGS